MNYAAKGNEDNILLLALKDDQKEDIWYLKIDVGNHMCRERNLFSDMNETIYSL